MFSRDQQGVRERCYALARSFITTRHLALTRKIGSTRAMWPRLRAMRTEHFICNTTVTRDDKTQQFLTIDYNQLRIAPYAMRRTYGTFNPLVGSTTAACLARWATSACSDAAKVLEDDTMSICISRSRDKLRWFQFELPADVSERPLPSEACAHIPFP